MYRQKQDFGGFSALELIVVLGLVLVISAMAFPKLFTLIQNARTAGDAQNLNGAILLAKMRAASDFTQVRVYADSSGSTFHIEVWNKPIPPATNGSWQTEGAAQSLSTGNSFAFGSLTTPPPNTQGALAEAPSCLNDTGSAPGTGSAIANTACIVFNSRGIPIDSTGTPTGNDALYVTDNNTVTGVTVSATGLTRIWRSEADNANWIKR